MKRFFRFLMAAAVMFGAVACSQTDELQEVTGGEEVVTTLSLELEDLGTRLAGDSGKIDKVAWGIYDQAGNFLAPHSSANKGVADFNGKKAEIEVRLFTGKVYDLVFFAYCSANNAYTIDWEARKLNVSYVDNANLEARDAFFHIENGFVAGPSATFTLKRPFAQLNAGQSMVDYNNMQLTQNCIIKSMLTTEAYAAMDLKTGDVVGDKVPVVLALNDVIDLNGDGNNDHLLVGKEPNVTEYKHLSMNYLLVDDKELVDVQLNLLGNEGTDFVREYFNVPLQRNYRTNILGSLISEPSVFTILIDAEFDGDHAVAVDPETSALEDILAPLYNQETAHVALQQNVTWTTGASHGSTPLVPAGSPLMELVIEGTNITRESVQPTIYFIGEGIGPVRAANGGKIIFRNVKIVDLSESYNEAAWELGYLEMAGNLEFENCTFVNAVMVCGGTANNDTAGNATFKNCYFNSYDENQYGAWVSGLNASFEECTFEGWRGLKTHEAYGSEVATLVVDNCDFTLTKKPGLAIGDVNAETEITIKNSTFSTQPGDQNRYIYETDTDVATFTLNLENNTIVLEQPVDADNTNLATLLQSNIQGEVNVDSTATVELPYIEMGDGTDATFNMNGAEIKSGTPTDYGFIVKGDAKVVVNDGNLKSGGGGVAVADGAEVEFDGNVHVSTTSTSGRYIFYVVGAETVLTINDGSYSWDSSLNQKRAYVYACEGAAVYIKGGTFGKASTRSGYTAGIMGDGTGKVIITGGTFGFDPSAWVAPGYKAIKNGTTWTIEDVSVKSGADLDAALASDEAEIYIAAGEYTMPAGSKFTSDNVITCAPGTKFVGNSKLNINGATIIGATFSNPSGSAVDQTINGTFKKCTFEGSNALRWCYSGTGDNTIVFEECVFSGSVYGIHFDGGEKPVIFRNCTISGFNALSSAIELVTFEGCKFVGNGKSGYNGANLWGSTKLVNCEFTFDGTTSTEWIDFIGADKTYEVENCTVNGVPYTPDNYNSYPAIFSRNNVTIKINGVDCAM